MSSHWGGVQIFETQKETGGLTMGDGADDSAGDRLELTTAKIMSWVVPDKVCPKPFK